MSEIDDLFLAFATTKVKAPRKAAAKKPRKAGAKVSKAAFVGELSGRDSSLIVPGAKIAFVFPCHSDMVGALTGATAKMLFDMCKETNLQVQRCSQFFLLGDYVSFNDFNKVMSHPFMEAGVERVTKQLMEGKYDMVILMGKHVLKKLVPGSAPLDDERGAPMLLPWGLTLCTYHPKDCFIDFSLSLVCELDLSKAHRLAKNGWKPKECNIVHSPTFNECCMFLDRLAVTPGDYTCDIETTYTTLYLTCIGFASSSYKAFVIPWRDHGKPHWTVNEEMILLRKLDKVMKTRSFRGQNGVHFDHFALARVYNISSNFSDDTMLLHWEMHPELPKSLGFINAFYTDNQYWKSMLKKARKGDAPPHAERVYNGLDNTNTHEAFDQMMLVIESPDFNKDALKHYRFNVEVAKVLNYMSLHGAYFNTQLVKDKLLDLMVEKSKLNRDLSIKVGKEMNVSSPQQMAAYLYTDLGLPIKYKNVLGKDGDYEERETADYLTTLLLAKEFPHYRQLELISTLRKLNKRISSLNSVQTRVDKKVGWGFNIVGTTTGRLSSYKPSDDQGVQAQNVDRNDRDLYSFETEERLAQFRKQTHEGKWIYDFPEKLEEYPEDFNMWLKADLEGADSWTVGAQLYALGEPRLFDDLTAKMKPAQVLALAMLLKDNDVMTLPVEKLLEMKKLLKSPEGKEAYKVAKAVNHGSAYMMAERTMNLNIFKFSKGEVWVSPEKCKILQQMLFKRYNYPKLHVAIHNLMLSRSYIDMPYGHRHYFYGRKDASTQRAMLASMPQYNTTVTANVVLHRLFYDPINRKGDKGDFFLHPANQVHDETDGRFILRDLETVKKVWHSVKDVPLTVMGVDFKIPFEVEFGPTWGFHPFTI